MKAIEKFTSLRKILFHLQKKKKTNVQPLLQRMMGTVHENFCKNTHVKYRNEPLNDSDIISRNDDINRLLVCCYVMPHGTKKQRLLFFLTSNKATD